MAWAIHVAVRLGLPDLLANRLRKLSDLLLATASDEPTLHRLLRCLKHLPSGAAVECKYDAQDNLVRYRDENGAVTKLEYCGLWEIRRRRQPDGHTVQFYYDTAERLIGVTNQRGERYELRRDPLGTCCTSCRIVGGLREDGCSVKSFIY